MKICVISTSLNGASRSRLLAEHAAAVLRDRAEETDLIDLAGMDLPFCDGDTVYGDERVGALAARIAGAAGVILALPIYNYSAGASAKNLIELTGSAWSGKVVGVMATAGGTGSSMAPMGLIGSLMLDFRCVVVPRFVVATDSAFGEAGVTDERVRGRVGELASEVVRFARALGGVAVEE